MTVTVHAPDAVTIEVVRNALEATAEEMSLVMLRTAHSPLFSEAKDYSCVIYDRNGEALAQAQNCPIHLASIQFALAECLAAMDDTSDPIADGDVLIVNDPYLGGSHLPDITLFKPIFLDGTLVAYAANRAHHVDIGGWAPGSFTANAEEIFQEGLRIPPIKLYRGGKPQGDIWKLMLQNVRDPASMTGDLLAQVASLDHVERKMKSEIIPKFGMETIEGCRQPILDYSEKLMRQAIEAIPDGTYTAVDYVEGDGVTDVEHAIRVKITVEGSNLTADFDGSSAQALGPVNAPFAVTSGAVYIAILAMTDPDIPTNAGCYRPITVLAPSGSIVNPLPPASVVAGNTYTSCRVIDTIRKALSEAIPDRATGGIGDHMQILAGGVHPRTGLPYQFYEFSLGGWGAGPDTDGVDAAFSLNGNCPQVPVEIFESRFPWRIEQMRLRPGSGGTGAHTGGMGMQKDFVLVEGSARVTLACDRTEHAPYGLASGGDAEPAQLRILRGGEEIPVASKISDLVLTAGEGISLRSPGGGGYGAASADSGTKASDV